MIPAELYRLLKQKFGTHDEETRVEFQIRTNVDVATWVERGMHVFDERSVLPYPTADAMKSAAAEHLLSACQDGSSAGLRAGLDRFLAPFEERCERVNNILRASFGPIDFFDWLYSAEHITLTYGLSYQGTSLENLSPGMFAR